MEMDREGNWETWADPRDLDNGKLECAELCGERGGQQTVNQQFS